MKFSLNFDLCNFMFHFHDNCVQKITLLSQIYQIYDDGGEEEHEKICKREILCIESTI